MNGLAFFNKRRLGLVLGVLLVLLAASASIAFAQAATTGDGTISACVYKDGTLYISNTEGCKSNTTLLTWNITGPQGPQGEQGLQGEQGPQGDPGPAGAQGEQGPVGATGEAGPAGLPGPQGEMGPAGQQGVTGADGKSAYDVAAENGYIGSVADWLASLVGAPGPKGDTGDQGPQGLQGETGPAGPQGSQGLQGPAGIFNITQIYVTESIDPNESKQVYAWCGYGRKVLGGGVSGNEKIQIFQSKPWGESWLIEVRNTDWLFETDATAYAICATVN